MKSIKSKPTLFDLAVLALFFASKACSPDCFRDFDLCLPLVLAEFSSSAGALEAAWRSDVTLDCLTGRASILGSFSMAETAAGLALVGVLSVLSLGAVPIAMRVLLVQRLQVYTMSFSVKPWRDVDCPGFFVCDVAFLREGADLIDVVHDTLAISIFPQALHTSRRRAIGSDSPAFAAMLSTSASNTAALVVPLIRKCEAALCR